MKTDEDLSKIKLSSEATALMTKIAEAGLKGEAYNLKDEDPDAIRELLSHEFIAHVGTVVVH